MFTIKVIKVTGFGDFLLEEVLRIALENTSKETGLPQDDVVGLTLSVVNLATKKSCRKSTVRLMTNITQALKAAGWEEDRSETNKEVS